MGEVAVGARKLQELVLELAGEVGLIIETRKPESAGARTSDPAQRRYVTAKAWARANELLKRSFDDDTMLSNPVWNILLDLYISRCERRAISVSSATIASAVPPTTGLRWITYLQEEGLIERRDSPVDRRIVYLELTDLAMRKIDRALDGVTESNERLGIGHLRLVE